jgi:hypothetical protein
MMKLFTFIVEHEGASSISQISSKDVGEGFSAWRQALGKKLGTILPAKDVATLRVSLQEEKPIAVRGRTNVWFTCGRTHQGLARITIVATDARQQI